MSKDLWIGAGGHFLGASSGLHVLKYTGVAGTYPKPIRGKRKEERGKAVWCHYGGFTDKMLSRPGDPGGDAQSTRILPHPHYVMELSHIASREG